MDSNCANDRYGYCLEIPSFVISLSATLVDLDGKHYNELVSSPYTDIVWVMQNYWIQSALYTLKPFGFT